MVLEIILWIIRFFFGAGIFSFLHIVIDKLTYGKSAICAKSKRIARYFLVELTGGVSMTGCAIVYGCGKMGVISLRGAVFFIYLGILFVIALVDWHIQMIYDRFHIMILILAVLDFILYPEMGIATKLTGMGIISVPMLVLALAIPGAFGGGDIKLMSVSGLLIGGASMICAMCIGIITGGAYVTLMLVRKRLNKTDQFAFGPFLAFGLATAIFWEIRWQCGICSLGRYRQKMICVWNCADQVWTDKGWYDSINAENLYISKNNHRSRQLSWEL